MTTPTPITEAVQAALWYANPIKLTMDQWEFACHKMIDEATDEDRKQVCLQLATTMKKEIGQCRDCQHWQSSKFQLKQLETCPRDLAIEEADVYAECKRIEKGLLVELLKIQKWDDSELDYIETSANFGCLFFKPQPL